MRVSIGGRPYTVGLLWTSVESAEDIADRRDETGRDVGVILRAGRKPVSLGLAAEEEGRGAPPSAAALLALAASGPALAVEWVEREDGQRAYWVAATLGGAVVPGTDVLHEDKAAVRRLIDDLRGDAEYRILGEASAEFGGSGEPALPADRKLLAKATPRPLDGELTPARLAILLGLLAAAGLAAWLGLRQEAAPPQAPMVDLAGEQERRRQAAIAARNQRLSEDLSGFSVRALAAAGMVSGRGIAHSAAYWKLKNKACDRSTCTIVWNAIAPGAVPAALAAGLGLSREKVAHDTRAETVSVGVPLEAVPERVEASASTALDGRVWQLVDRCRRYSGLGGTCELGDPQPVQLPDATLLPPELAYRTGTLVLSGPVSRADRLLALFADAETSRWVRGDRIGFDAETLQFRLEGHYVVP